MRVTLWGTRGSLPTPGPETNRYGGNTSCVEVRGDDGTVLVLDAGSGIRRLGAHWLHDTRRVHILLTHLHMDHIQGLGFFAPLQDPDMEVHIYGPPSNGHDLETRLGRYLSPPLFPVHLRELPCQLTLHSLTEGSFEIGDFLIESDLVIHPGPTLGYRISDAAGTLTYLPDHEPALGSDQFPTSPKWTSGHRLAAGSDLLIHDAQYTTAEYEAHIGWGHSSVPQVLAFAGQARVKHLLLFHHDPMHTDTDVDHMVAMAHKEAPAHLCVTGACEGETFDLTATARAHALHAIHEPV
jgi:phosphoribosyl 1,2-cyclic phosphodiesterase